MPVPIITNRLMAGHAERLAAMERRATRLAAEAELAAAEVEIARHGKTSENVARWQAAWYAVKATARR
ncbi:hypothetical protein [Microcella alkalica]|uniref:hypothetical protein n=1 Tax=Microcella alkalica TaxID=355930 RepID=UPI00145FC3E4|nr:hypothetical protein [Microcella alkalica]